VNFFGHAGEVAEHLIIGNKTDPKVIYRGLNRLGVAL
jgi:hypothetical protein